MSKGKDKKHTVPNHLLEQAREQRGWTQRYVADLIGLPDAHTVGRWERGKNTPSLHYRQKLCSIFEKSPGELGLIKYHDPQETQDTEVAALNQQNNPIWKVPTAFTTFVGRKKEVSEVCALLQDSNVRLVTLLGPGGVGKTRLSIQIATELRDHFADGVCFVSLAALKEATLVLPTIARTLDIQENSPSSDTELPIQERVKVALQDKRLLLIVDNFEQVTTAAPSLEELLAHCPHLKILVTSRIVLHLPAEHEFSLAPLTLPELEHLPTVDTLLEQAAIMLFVQRAQNHQADFSLTPENAQAIAEICVRLDGLPLAIELAAAQIKLFPPQALLARLLQSSQFLVNRLQTVAERQQTLHNTITWSYDLLNEEEQHIFRYLSVFRGSFALEAVEALFHKEPAQQILNTLSALVDKSLLQPAAHKGSQPRFMILETIREYGLSCLRTCGELETVQQAHAMYYFSLLEKAEPHLKDEQQGQWLSILEPEQENLRTALEWFITQKKTTIALRFSDIFGKFYGLRGYWSEELRWLKAVLALPQADDRIERARVLRRAGHLAYRLRDLPTARTLLEESVTLSQKTGENQNLAGALSTLGLVHYRQKDIIAAKQLLEEGVCTARKTADPWTIANALETLGLFMYRQGNNSKAHDLLEESITLARQLGDKESLARFLTTLVSIELAQQHHTQAEALAQEAATLAQELGTKPLIALTLDRLGEVALAQGEYIRAESIIYERIRLTQELGDMATIAAQQLQLGKIALEREDIPQATALAQQSLEFFQKQGDNPNIEAAQDLLSKIEQIQTNEQNPS